ncbi:thioredoxin TrxC [Mangrovimicrobium sediminis]|uniref:Thioredoxin n=1 Tax=Mangrovimicrobium sediminis TaxID=2562682 RepID=A0A4Z0LUG7_9GAMM|nr:thioredoxin TrxC [Haliea sp. SAOS-164]TGD70899.1 thioredoxin TrxC [Haliea sp. SAOS-164]
MTTAPKLQMVCPQCQAINRVPVARLGDRPACGKCHHALAAGEPVAVDDQGFQRFVANSDLPVVVDFWAPWCGPCRQFAPVFSQAAAQAATRAVFIKLDTEACPTTAAQFQIRSIPTLMVMQRGRELARLSGALPPAQFQQWLEQNLPGPEGA